MISATENSIELVAPNYKYWLRQDSWTVEEACFLLIGIDPQLFEENSKKFKYLNLENLILPKEFEEKLNQNLVLREKENKFDQLFEQLYEELNSRRFKRLMSDELDPELVMFWAIKENKKINVELRKFVREMGLSKGEPVGDFKNLDDWLIHDAWSIEEAVLLIRGFSPDSQVFWKCFEPYEDLVHKAISAKKIQAKPRDPSQIRGIARLDRLLIPGEFIKWAESKWIVAKPEFFKKVTEDQESTKEIANPRPSNVDKFVIQAIARCLWDKSPSMTIAAVVKDKWVQTFGNGKLYRGKNTLRDWVREVDPRQAKEKTGRPKKISITASKSSEKVPF